MTVKPLICIAGVSGIVYKYIEENKYFFNKEEEINYDEANYDFFTGDRKNPPIIHELENRGDTIRYQNGASDPFLDDLVKRLVGDCSNESTGIGLVYVDYTGSKEFVEQFYPFAITVPIEPFYPSTWPKNSTKHEIKEIIEKIKKATKLVKRRIGMMSGEVSGNKLSPLLLPLVNFQSDILRNGIRSIFDQIGNEDFDPSLIRRVSDEIRTAHLNKQESAKKFFEDTRSLQFKSPGSANHGVMERVTNSHLNRCLINSRVRLGAPIIKGFHYDCSYENREIDGIYTNCHAGTANISSRKNGYINISPSDSIREEDPAGEAKKIRRRNRRLKHRNKEKLINEPTPP